MAGLAFEGVSKVFPDGTKAVSDFTLEVGDGELMILVGPSGSGKSTALRMLGGLEEATTGTIRIGSRAVSSESPRRRATAPTRSPIEALSARCIRSGKPMLRATSMCGYRA